jgi:hypothetical protein
MRARKLFIFIFFFLVFTFLSQEVISSSSEYETDLVITAYNIHLRPDFERNLVKVAVLAEIENFSSISIGKTQIMLCTLIDTGDLRAEVKQIFWLRKGRKDPLNFSIKTVKNPFDAATNISLYELFFREPLKPREKVVLEFVYTIKGKSIKDSFPLGKGETKELYLISDFRWLPQIFIPAQKVGQFNNIYKPEWTLRIEYPSLYVAVVDGQLIKKTELNGNNVEEWKSIIKGFPQVLIGQYEKVKKSEGKFTIEIYTPKDQEIKEAVNFLSKDIFKILQLYFDLYGDSGSTVYRLVASYTTWGGHGLYMGQVIDRNYLKSLDLFTIAHEIAHTWWGFLITSYGEGSKFLREAMANFSAAWALKQIKGEAYFVNALRGFKTGTFCYYVALNRVDKQYPLVIQEGYDPRSIVFKNYQKGPLVLNTLRFELKDELFFQCLRAVVENFKDRNITLSTFIDTFNQVSGRNLTPLFRDLCWGTGYPIYQLVHFESVKAGEKYKTIVRIKNEGDIGVLCPLMLSTINQRIVKWFKVSGKKDKEFSYLTQDKVINVVLDPEMVAFQYSPEQGVKLWESLDESLFGLRNWAWFNKSYACYLRGKYEKAIDILSRYLNEAKELIPNIERLPVFGVYRFVRGFYYLAINDEENAEKDIKIGIPFLFDSLMDKNIMFFFTLTGVIKEAEPEKNVILILNKITGKDFTLEADLDDQSRRQKVNGWKEWWEKEGKYKKLNLKELKNIKQI